MCVRGEGGGEGLQLRGRAALVGRLQAADSELLVCWSLGFLKLRHRPRQCEPDAWTVLLVRRLCRVRLVLGSALHPVALLRIHLGVGPCGLSGVEQC